MIFSYKKQSSGKDLSSRSNNELDCIFGWNKTNQKNTEEAKQQSDEEKVLFKFYFICIFILYLKETETLSDNHYITSKQSINDYFKQKSKKKAEKQYQQIESLNNQQTSSSNDT